MDDLRDKIETIRFANVNTDNHHFVPQDALFQVVSESAIKLSLRNLEIPIHELPELAHRIMQGARKCFAILILIGRGGAIVDFFRRDLLQPTCPDDRLPYVAEVLGTIFNEGATSLTIRRFLEKQWEFAIPVMHQQMIFRQLDRNVILPILHKEDAGRGAMGTVFKLELHPQYHKLPLCSHKVINKQIQCRPGDDKTVFQREIENLALLTGLKHPNIVQLYCSYMYRDTYNLFFAVADGGSLEDFLKQDQGGSGLSGARLLLALAELADALDAMHNFTSDALNLSLSGCHHDLAPRNILVHGDTFLLADFGLSTFRAADEDSMTMFKEVRGSYMAPECQAIHNDQIISGQVNRASDVWSFGCILMEVLIHATQGPAGLENFRNRRISHVTSEIDWFRFHQGPGKPNAEVDKWLAMLWEAGEPSSRRLVNLIREMLAMDPSDRPQSRRVLKVIRGIAILSLSDTIKADLDGTSRTNQATGRTLGHLRFESWLFAFNRFLDEISSNSQSKTDFDFPTTLEALQEIRCILNSQKEHVVKHQQQSLLRYQHQRLMQALPSKYRSIAKDHLTKQVMQNRDSESIGSPSNAILDTSMDHDVGNLIAVRHLMDLAENGRLGADGDSSNLLLEPKDIWLKEPLGHHTFAVLKATSEAVLVEWLRYGEEWVDERIGLELQRRLTSVVRLLNDERTAQILGSLRCKGIYPDPSYPGFGIIYEMPLPGTRPILLHSLLDAAKGLRPLLECRFRLAFDICRHIYTFHKVGWLHRNFHSMNILCFPPSEAENSTMAQNPRIFGFASSRENQTGSFTHGPDRKGQFRNYHHPDYLARHELYREEFDYYSAGIVLLEIGHWTTLFELTKSKRFQGISEEQFRTELLTSRVPQLGLIMGTRYMEATRVCLQGGFAKRADAKDAWYTAFKKLVIDQIPLIDDGNNGS